MPGVHREGDATTGHGCPPGGPCTFAPPTIPATYSSTVITNFKGTVRQLDLIVPHPCLLCLPVDDVPCVAPCAPHTGSYIGVHDVIVENRDIQTCMDPISCTGFAATCSPNVKVND